MDKYTNKNNGFNKLKDKLKTLSDISDDTAEQYAYRLKRLYKMLGNTDELKNINFLVKDQDEILKVLKASDIPLNSKSSIIASVLIFVKPKKRIYDKYKKMFDGLKEEIKEYYNKQNKSTRETGAWLTKEDIKNGHKKLFDKALKTEKLKDFQKMFIYNLYSRLPARRGIDYARMLINGPDNYEGNVVKTNKEKKFEKFIFNKFKLSKTKGKEEFDRDFMSKLPKGREILDFLDAWLQLNDTQWFLTQPYTNNNITKYVMRIFKWATDKDTSINILRHIYITNFLDGKQYLTDRDRVAKFMSHSLNTQSIYQKRDEKKEEPKEEEKKPVVEIEI